jgi:hypothetical protein
MHSAPLPASLVADEAPDPDEDDPSLRVVAPSL